MKIRYCLYLITALLLTGCNTTRQTQNTAINTSSTSQTTTNRVKQYILKYYPVAVEHMNRHRIPASITLAQAILEGNAGKSELVETANNHFGVKAGNRWNGRTVRAFDDGEWCNFRAYDSDIESYEDHSRFLLTNNRYRGLFDLEITDYKGWARGLKKAGYATDSQYAEKLISVIERYELYRYDSYTGSREILKANGLAYTIARAGDTFKSISDDTGVSKRKLRNYNDLYKDYIIKEGEIIYLERKNRRATRGYEFHTVANGESLHSIAQKYGIRLECLYDMNPQYKSYTTLKVGDVIRLR